MAGYSGCNLRFRLRERIFILACMESFWESIRDIFFLLLKAFVILLVIQIVLHFGDWGISIPYIGGLVSWVLSLVGL